MGRNGTNLLSGASRKCLLQKQLRPLIGGRCPPISLVSAIVGLAVGRTTIRRRRVRALVLRVFRHSWTYVCHCAASIYAEPSARFSVHPVGPNDRIARHSLHRRRLPEKDKRVSRDRRGYRQPDRRGNGNEGNAGLVVFLAHLGNGVIGVNENAGLMRVASALLSTLKFIECPPWPM